MDAFKQVEIERMRLGGNENWRTFFEQHEDTQMRGISWDDATIAERYSGEVGDEWKERLAAKVEGREYQPGEKKAAPAAAAATNAARSSTPLSGNAQSRTASPGRKAKVDDVYFSKLGAENAARSDHLPPSQGGKYGGFGNTPMSQPKNDDAPSWDELQKDPMAGLTKGFGWFTSAVSKTAKNVNDGYIQPTAKQVGPCPGSDAAIPSTHAANADPNIRLPPQTSQSRPSKRLARLAGWPSRELAMLRTGSAGSSKGPARAAAVTGRHPWMIARETFGTISQVWPTSSATSRPVAEQ